MRIFQLLFLTMTLGCGKKDTQPDQAGRVSGTVRSMSGVPINDVHILVDHSIFFNSNLSTKSDSQGRYSLSLPKTGGWYAFAIHRAAFNDKIYQCYLHPEDPAGFGSEGAVKNFTWKISGQKAQPLTGYYGGTITADHFPGVYLDTEKIQFTLVPQGNLIDGSTGQKLIRNASDGIQLLDVPMGRYRISAKYQNKDLKLRRWNSDDQFVKELVFDFEPHIDAQCNNCFKIEYNQ